MQVIASTALQTIAKREERLWDYFFLRSDTDLLHRSFGNVYTLILIIKTRYLFINGTYVESVCLTMLFSDWQWEQKWNILANEGQIHGHIQCTSFYLIIEAYESGLFIKTVSIIIMQELSEPSTKIVAEN